MKWFINFNLIFTIFSISIFAPLYFIARYFITLQSFKSISVYKKDVIKDTDNYKLTFSERVFYLYGFNIMRVKIKGNPYTLIYNKRYNEAKDTDDLCLLREYKPKKLLFYIGE